METNVPMTGMAQQSAIPPQQGIPSAVPIGAKVIAALFYIAAITFIFSGIMAAFISSLSLLYLGSFGLTTGLVPGAAAVAWGVLSFFAGKGLWSGQQWGKILAIVMNGLYIIFGIVGLLMLGGTNYISLIINLIIVAYLLFSKGVAAAFQEGKSTGTIIIPAVLAIVIYAVMVYPSLTPQQTALNQASQLTKQLYRQSNNQNTNPSQDTYTPDPAYGPVVQGLTQPGTYTNSTYGLQMNIPFAYSVQEEQGTPAYVILISGTKTAMILIWTAPTTLPLQDMIKKDMGDLISGDTLTNTTVAGEPAMHDQSTASGSTNYNTNIYFLIHDGNYYRIQKTGSFKIGQIITDSQFNSAVQSLRFTK